MDKLVSRLPWLSRSGTAGSSKDFQFAEMAVWGRFVVLFLGLCLVKLGLLFELREHLTQIHWRFGGFYPTWADHVAFYLCVAVGIVAVGFLARGCEPKGPRVVRKANALLLALGFLFLLLTFHEGDKNYLYPVMTGVLDWKDLGAYLSLDFFFRPPFLAAWLVGYALVYWGLVRTRREHFALRVTTICAAAYALLFFRDLPRQQAVSSDLLIVAAIGVTALIGAWRASRPLGVAWVWITFGWIGAIWLLLAQNSDLMRQPNPYLIVATAGTVAVFLAAELISRRGGFHYPWSNLAPFFFATFLLFVLNNYPSASNDQSIFAVALCAPRYFVGELLVATTVLLCAAAWRRWRPRATLLPIDLLCLLILAIAFVDLRLTGVMGARLDWDVLTFGYSAKMMWRLARPYLPGLALGLTGLVAGYVLLLRVLARTTPAFGSLKRRWSLSGAIPVALISACLLAWIGLVRVNPDKALGESVIKVAASSPAWRSLTKVSMDPAQVQSEASALGIRWLRTGAVAPPPPGTNRLNVVFILLESTYNQYLSLFGGTEQTQPLLSRYRDRMEIFPDFFSNFMGSIQARFACFTGLYPSTDYHQFTLQRVPVKSLFEIFNEQGYTCSMFYSSHYDYTCFRDFLRGRGLAEMYDADNMPGERETAPVSWGLQETETVGAIKSRIDRHAKDGDRFFLTYIPACPHNPFDAIPEQFKKHALEEMGDYTPRYLNALLYMDWAVSSIVDELDRNGLLDRTLVVITGDHGEMLGADGGKVGHGWYVTPQLANVPLIILNPLNKGFHVNHTIGSQVDLLPTVSALAGVPLPDGQVYQGDSLYRSGIGDRVIYINSYGQFGFVRDGVMSTGDRADQGANDQHWDSWSILNDGAHTRFETIPAQTQASISVDRFEQFQTALLQSYATVREALSDGAPADETRVASAGDR